MTIDRVRKGESIIEYLFSRKYAIQHHRDALFLSEREAYLRHLFDGGQSTKVLRDTAALLLHVIRVLQYTKARGISRSEIKEGGKRWAAEILAHRRTSKKSALRFSTVANGWLRYQNCIRNESAVTCRFDAELGEFSGFLHTQTGSLSTTIEGIEGPAGRFVQWIAKRHDKLSSVSYIDIDDFQQECRGRGWRSCTLAGYCYATRTFLRYAEGRGWCTDGLSKSIVNPTSRIQDWEVAGPSWKDVRLLIEGAGGSTPSQIRTKAILLLSATYALRNSELSRLKLDDFDWLGETFSLKRSKQGPWQRFPIQEEVGASLFQYLKHVRPRCACRSLFVTFSRPYRPLTRFAPTVERRMKAEGIKAQTHGTHGIRHACATELLRNGSSLRNIAAFLGHRDIRSVSIYARYDAMTMHEVANFSLNNIL